MVPSSSFPPSTIHLHPPSDPANKPAQVTYIIYFITGNPGLIEYYRTFLTHLYGLLTPTSSSRPRSLSPKSPNEFSFQVFGRSLSGFEVGSRENAKSRRNDEKGNTIGPPYGLQDQIEHAEEALVQLVNGVKSEGARDVRVILMGHSVGSYILLEIVRRLREHALSSPIEGIRIIGGICLFPTVVDIAKSDSGKKATRLLDIQNFALVVSILAKFLTLLLPTLSLARLISLVMKFPEDAAHVTASFVKSKHGVRQALHMARDEMHTITHDTWDAEVWGASHSTTHPHSRPILYFLFASSDHWVADETRDQLIQTRGRVPLSSPSRPSSSRGTSKSRSRSSGKGTGRKRDSGRPASIEGYGLDSDSKAGQEGEKRGDSKDDGNDEGAWAGEVDKEGDVVEEWKPIMEVDEKEGWVHGFCIRQSVPVAEKVCGYVEAIVGRDLHT